MAKVYHTRGEMGVKVGIITFQRADNYGAILQCYALYKTIADLNCDVEVIDYRNPVIERGYVGIPRLRKNFIKWTIEILYRSLHKRKHGLFEEFRKKISFSRSFSGNDIKNEGLNYDVIIVGSDQVWNPLTTKYLDDIYLLDFPGNYRRCAYAVSLGDIDNEVFKKKEFIDKVKCFHTLSVREQSGVGMISQMSGMEVKWCLDPTFLLSKWQWNEIGDEADIDISEHYILLCQINNNSELSKIAKYVSSNVKLPIIGCTQECPKSRHIQWMREAGPMEFIKLIRNADIVITSSFHALAFSAMYEKELHILPPKKNGDRLKSLADLYKIRQRVYNSYDDFIGRYNPKEKIRYQYNDLYAQQTASMRFLYDVLKEKVD